MSDTLKQVNPRFQTPGAAVWVGGVLSIIATLYGGAFLVLSTGCAVFLYLSYLMPIAAAHEVGNGRGMEEQGTVQPWGKLRSSWRLSRSSAVLS